MRELPLTDPGRPVVTSPGRFLVWLLVIHRRPVFGITVASSIWLISQAVMPTVLGNLVDSILQVRTDLTAWCALLVAIGVVQAVAGAMTHRIGTYLSLAASYRTVQLIAAQASRLGGSLTRRISAGDIAVVSTTDLNNMGGLLKGGFMAVGGSFSLAAVVILMVRTDPMIGLVAVVGTVAMAVALDRVLRPLHRRQQTQRDLVGNLAGQANDVIAGLRIIHGFGSQSFFADRYHDQSRRVRASGIRVGRAEALLGGVQVLLPGALMTVVVLLAARQTAAGVISVGQLVTVYGSSTYLVFLVRTVSEAAGRAVRAHVAAERVVKILRLDPEPSTVDTPARLTSPGALVEQISGVAVQHGGLTAIAADRESDATAILRRLNGGEWPAARFEGVRFGPGGVDGRGMRVFLADSQATLFSGTVRDVVDPWHRAAPDQMIAALQTANAMPFVAELPAGLDSRVAPGGANFSGGQQQRLKLARALLANSEVLLLAEPTSAVDAPTEALIAHRLAEYRKGSTTVLTSTSPLMLDVVDTVVFVVGGRVVDSGPHRALLRHNRDYGRLVARTADA